ncbi:uncharacterized protein LOC120090724 [Benincasa hispida]|uniref:uncharacterized protein LOC120090724 n=1 Tax=Benincasa hispida TaxID=102211 RepID=UPI0019016E0E|nr:uncharacterized protein LOC120090724 [Benincasa hispida]
MVQKCFEEKLELLDQEISGFIVKMQKLPTIKENLALLAKIIKRLGFQVEKHQQMLVLCYENDQGTGKGSICGRFLVIKQETTVEAYRNQFDKLIALLPHLPNEVLEETFMNGLASWIKAEVECWDPTGLAQMMSFVQRVEDRENAWVEAGRARIDGGLTNPRTLKITGEIKRESVVILVDCEATHNFISESPANHLQLNITDTTNYGVVLGSGTTMQGKGVCKNVKMRLGDWRVCDSFQLLELGNADVILGMQWLHSLGKIEVDWWNLTMTFVHEGQKITLQGNPSLEKEGISLKCTMKIWDAPYEYLRNI